MSQSSRGALIALLLTCTATFAYAQPAPPAFSLPTGVYASSKHVVISDATAGVEIHYTTDSTIPTALSPIYTRPLTVATSITLRAIAIGTGGLSSPVANALYTIEYKAGDGPHYNTGFHLGALTLNSVAKLDGTTLELTDGGTSEATSAFYDIPINTNDFASDFTFQLTNPNGDGFTFCIQNNGPTAVGGGGGGLGFYTIPRSIAVKFDLYNNAGEGTDSTGLYLDGAVPTVPAIDMSSSGIDLHSGRIFHVRLIYANPALLLQVLDYLDNTKLFQTAFAVDIPATVGGATAYAGFTAGTGSATAVQKILTWNMISIPPGI